MNLSADMMGDETDDTFAVRCRQPFTRIGKALGETVDPEPPVWIEHHLDDAGVVEVARDGGAERGAQHPRAARKAF